MQKHLIVIIAGMLLSTHYLHAQDGKQLAAKAREILATNCHSCHGNNGTVEGGFSYLLDRQQLVARKKIIPGDAAKSKLFHRVQNEDMPPEGEKQRPSKEDIELLKKWIAAGAPDFNPVKSERKFVSIDEILKFMADDLKLKDPSDRKFIRYFTLTHLYNAGRSEDEIQSYRNGVAKLINSLSWGRKAISPAPIDSAKTILRIDLRDYKWAPKTWDLIAGADPYGLVYPSIPNAKALYTDAGCALPYVRGDWFVATASRPPLYHDVLQLPGTEQELETLLRVEVEENIRTGQAMRAGFNGSAVSRNNRLIERHESSYGYYWKSYDFGKNTDHQNLFAYPLGPGTSDKLFKHDGGELIFSLPNGFQGYMLVNGEGKRIQKGPTDIVSDPKRPDRAVENGVSCMSCHVRGILPKDDQIRAHVEKNPNAFSKKEAEAILGLYPAKDKLLEKMKEDAEKYRKAIENAGIQLGISEPIAVLAGVFESELDLPLAAAEANLKVEEFERLLKRSPALARVMGNLQTEGGTVQREAFTKSFPDIAKSWRLGTPAAKTTSTSGASITQGEGKWSPLGGKNPFPILFQASKAFSANKDGLITNGRNYVVTKKGDYLTKNFKFELLYTLKSGTAKEIVFVGLGEAERGVGSEPKNSVYFAIHPPNVDGGAIRFGNEPGRGIGGAGKISKEGTHRFILEKKGDVVTFSVDVDNDGTSDDDIEKIIPDITEVGKFLNKKNTHIFFGGGGTYKQFRLVATDPTKE